MEAKQLAERLLDVQSTPVVAFHTDDDWDDDGKLRATAPVYGPFIRRGQNWR